MNRLDCGNSHLVLHRKSGTMKWKYRTKKIKLHRQPEDKYCSRQRMKKTNRLIVRLLIMLTSHNQQRQRQPVMKVSILFQNLRSHLIGHLPRCHSVKVTLRNSTPSIPLNLSLPRQSQTLLHSILQLMHLLSLTFPPASQFVVNAAP